MINLWPHSGWKGYGGMLLLGLVLVGCGAAAEDKAASPPVEATSVGDEACAACHAEIVETYRYETTG